MTKYLISDEIMTDIADTIRAKTESQEMITPADMSSVIDTGTYSRPSFYKVRTIAERDALEDVRNGDVCLVINSSTSPIAVGDTLQTIKFNETITFPTAVTSNVTCYIQYGQSMMYRLQFTIKAASIQIRDYYTYDILASYTSLNGITYNLTSGSTSFTFGEEKTISSITDKNSLLQYITYKGSVVFDGVFSYKNQEWSNLDIGLSTKTDDVYKGVSFYDNTGKHVGTMLNNVNGLNIYRVEEYIEGLKTKPLMEELKNTFPNETYAFEEFNCGKNLVVGYSKALSHAFFKSSNLKKLDLSNVTFLDETENEEEDFTGYSLDYLYNGSTLEELILPKDMSLINSMVYLVQGGSNLTTIDLSNLVNNELGVRINIENIGSTGMTELIPPKTKINAVTTGQIVSSKSDSLTNLDLSNFDVLMKNSNRVWPLYNYTSASDLDPTYETQYSSYEQNVNKNKALTKLLFPSISYDGFSYATMGSYYFYYAYRSIHLAYFTNLDQESVDSLANCLSNSSAPTPTRVYLSTSVYDKLSSSQIDACISKGFYPKRMDTYFTYTYNNNTLAMFDNAGVAKYNVWTTLEDGWTQVRLSQGSTAGFIINVKGSDSTSRTFNANEMMAVVFGTTFEDTYIMSNSTSETPVVISSESTYTFTKNIGNYGVGTLQFMQITLPRYINN